LPRCIFIILAKAISCMPTPGICFWRSSSERSWPSSNAAIHSVAVDRTHNLPVERRTVYHWASSARAKSSSPMPRCQVMLRCAVGALLRNQRHEKKNQASFDYLPWFHAKPFLSDFERRGNISRQQPEPEHLLVCLSFVQQTFEWYGGDGFVWRGKCRDWGTTASK